MTASPTERVRIYQLFMRLFSNINETRKPNGTLAENGTGRFNDIGNTAEAYAREAFDRYGADAVTVNPYMGEDSVRPFLARPDRGAEQ